MPVNSGTKAIPTTMPFEPIPRSTLHGRWASRLRWVADGRRDFSSSLFSSVSRADDEAARIAFTSVCLVSVSSLLQCLHFSSPDLLSRCQSTFSFVFLCFSLLQCSSGVPFKLTEPCKSSFLDFVDYCFLLLQYIPDSFIPHFLQPGDSLYFSEQPISIDRIFLIAFFSFLQVPAFWSTEKYWWFVYFYLSL